MGCFFLSFEFGHFKCSKSMFPLKMRHINYGMHIYTERKPRKKTLGILTFLLYFFDTADLYKKKFALILILSTSMRAINVQCAQSCYLSLVLFMFAQYSFIEIQINVPWLSKRRKNTHAHTNTEYTTDKHDKYSNISV